MIKFISTDDLLSIRNEVLREGKLTPEECRFPTDSVPGAFHLGYYVADVLACIASFHPQVYGWQGSRHPVVVRNGIILVERHVKINPDKRFFPRKANLIYCFHNVLMMQMVYASFCRAAKFSI